MIVFESTDRGENPQRCVSLVYEDRRICGPAISRMLEDVLRSSVAGRTKEPNSPSNEFVRFMEFAGVAFWDIRQAHGVVAVSHRRRSTVVSGGRGEEAGNASGAAVQEPLVHRVVEEVVCSASPRVRVIVYGVGGVAEAGQKRRDTVPSVYGTGEEKESSSGANSGGCIWKQVFGAGETAICRRNARLLDCRQSRGLSGVAVRRLSETRGGHGVGAPWVKQFVEVHVGGGDDFRNGRHPDVIRAQR
eukprot:602571-Pleurochrysis_carterae.AAC.1